MTTVLVVMLGVCSMSGGNDIVPATVADAQDNLVLVSEAVRAPALWEVCEWLLKQLKRDGDDEDSEEDSEEENSGEEDDGYGDQCGNSTTEDACRALAVLASSGMSHDEIAAFSEDELEILGAILVDVDAKEGSESETETRRTRSQDRRVGDERDDAQSDGSKTDARQLE